MAVKAQCAPILNGQILESFSLGWAHLSATVQTVAIDATTVPTWV